MIRIRAFRAIDDSESCKKYAEEHLNVLKIFGITKITTANTDWMVNPDVYVIMAERIEDNIPVGGARIHLYNEQYPLPMETAIMDFDPNVKPLLQTHSLQGTGELCGLWNSRLVAGWGIGTMYITRASIAVASQLPISSLFVLCGFHTIGITLEKGFVIDERLGNQGTFYYPKEGLVATLAVLNDINPLSSAKESERDIIFSLRENLLQTRTEHENNLDLRINYQLDLKLK